MDSTFLPMVSGQCSMLGVFSVQHFLSCVWYVMYDAHAKGSLPSQQLSLAVGLLISHCDIWMRTLHVLHVMLQHLTCLSTTAGGAEGGTCQEQQHCNGFDGGAGCSQVCQGKRVLPTPRLLALVARLVSAMCDGPVLSCFSFRVAVM